MGDFQRYWIRNLATSTPVPTLPSWCDDVRNIPLHDRLVMQHLTFSPNTNYTVQSICWLQYSVMVGSWAFLHSSEKSFCWWFMHSCLYPYVLHVIPNHYSEDTSHTCMYVSLFVLVSYSQSPWHSFIILSGTSTTMNGSCVHTIKINPKRRKNCPCKIYDQPPFTLPVTLFTSTSVVGIVCVAFAYLFPIICSL